MTLRDAIELLAIREREITKTKVKAAYRILIFKWHPDRHSGEDNVRTATDMAQNVNLAYEVLSNILEIEPYILNPLIMNDQIEELPQPSHYSRPERTTRAQQSNSRWNSNRRFWSEVVEQGFPDETVFEVFFESSHLVSAGYDAVSRTLYQKFLEQDCKTVVYRYFNVPVQVWNELLNAKSHGSYAYRKINHAFRYERCTEPNSPYNERWRFSSDNYSKTLLQIF
jgi:curved DNA-binding protein CbpA